MVKSINKGNPIHGLEKIPDGELLKMSQRELGEWKSYAQELEDKVTELEKKLDEKQGFYTSKGRFVTREEGLIIARAAGQVGDIIGGVLTSEDLY